MLGMIWARGLSKLVVHSVVTARVWMAWCIAMALLFVALAMLLVVIMLVFIRALWDPLYCNFVSSTDIDILHSAPIQRINDHLYIFEHMTTSGQTWLQRSITKFSRMVVVVDGSNLCLFSPCPLTDSVKADLLRLGRVSIICVTNCFHYMWWQDIRV